MSKHTPGPWQIIPATRYGSAKVEAYNQPGSNVQIALFCTAYLSEEQNLANAKLVAAAPELLELAKEIRRNYALDSIYFVEKLDAIVAKAEGK